MRLAARLEQVLDENRLVLRAQRIEPLAASHGGGGLHVELLVRLREIGVHYAQRFLLHQPEPARELLHTVVTGLQGSAGATKRRTGALRAMKQHTRIRVKRLPCLLRCAFLCGVPGAVLL
jgi:hypothetical protein